MVLRFVYNRKRLEMDAVESIPHLEIWKKMLSFLANAFHELFDRARTTMRRFKGDEGYNIV